MSFFDSEVVRAEMSAIGELQDEVYKSIFNFSSMDRVDKIHHVGVLEKLLEKQKIFYMRVSLSDDPEAIKMKEHILESAKMMGLPSNVNMSIIFNSMSDMLETMKKYIDISDSDL